MFDRYSSPPASRLRCAALTPLSRSSASWSHPRDRTYQQHVAAHARTSGPPQRQFSPCPKLLSLLDRCPDLCSRRSEMQADAKPTAAPSDDVAGSEPALIKNNQASSKLECTMPVRTHTACRQPLCCGRCYIRQCAGSVPILYCLSCTASLSCAATFTA